MTTKTVARRSFTPAFKAKVASTRLEGKLTLAEIATKYGISESQVYYWTNQVSLGLATPARAIA